MLRSPGELLEAVRESRTDQRALSWKPGEREIDLELRGLHAYDQAGGAPDRSWVAALTDVRTHAGEMPLFLVYDGRFDLRARNSAGAKRCVGEVVRGGWGVLEAIAGAQEGEAAEALELIEVEAEPFGDPGPEPAHFEAVTLDSASSTNSAASTRSPPGAAPRSSPTGVGSSCTRTAARRSSSRPSATHFFARATPVQVDILRDEAGQVEAMRVHRGASVTVARRWR